MFNFYTVAQIDLTEQQAQVFMGLVQKLHPNQPDLYKSGQIGYNVNIKLSSEEQALLEGLLEDFKKYLWYPFDTGKI